MRATRVIFPAKGQVGLETVDLAPPQAHEVLVEIDYTIISPGTDLAFLHAMPGTSGVFPQWAGYCACGRVVARGSGVTQFDVGQRVVCGTLHGSGAVVDAGVADCAAAPDGLDAREAAAYHLVAIALQGVRKGRIQLGDAVLVLGLGVIGNLAGQLARAAGATVVAGADPVAWRQDVARQTGFDFTGDSAERLLAEGSPLPARVRGRGFDVVIEATGAPEPINHALAAAARMGRVVLLGSTRGTTERVDFYRDVHKKGLTLIGAHASIRPASDEPGPYRTLRSDVRTSLELMAARRIQVAPLLSATLPGREAPQAYARLSSRNEPLMTIALDWRGVSTG